MNDSLSKMVINLNKSVSNQLFDDRFKHYVKRLPKMLKYVSDFVSSL